MTRRCLLLALECDTCGVFVHIDLTKDAWSREIEALPETKSWKYRIGRDYCSQKCLDDAPLPPIERAQ